MNEQRLTEKEIASFFCLYHVHTLYSHIHTICIYSTYNISCTYIHIYTHMYKYVYSNIEEMEEKTQMQNVQ